MLKLFFFIFISSIFGSDHYISQHSRQRHRALLENYQAPEEKIVSKRFERLLRTLASAGITLDSTFTTDMLGNPVGGRARGFAYAGSYGLSININCSKWVWEGFDLFSSAVWRTGTNLSQRKIGNQFNVAQVFGSQTVKLNELYFLQTLFDGNFEFKAGRLNAGNDFLASPFYARFVNNGFDGNPVSIFLNMAFVAYPNATWGSYLMFKPTKRLSIKAGAYNANNEIKKAKYHGVNFTFKSTNGVIWVTEWCALVNQEKEDRGLSGNYKIGYVYQTGRTQKFIGGEQNGDPCLYFLFDQMIYRRGNTDQGLTPFIAMLFAPKNRNLFPVFIDGGLVFKGLFKSRPDDYANVGFIYGRYSSTQEHLQKEQGIEPQNYEVVLEASYWAQINRLFYIMPDMQYIIRPKGTNLPNAWVIGAQIGITTW